MKPTIMQEGFICIFQNIYSNCSEFQSRKKDKGNIPVRTTIKIVLAFVNVIVQLKSCAQGVC